MGPRNGQNDSELRFPVGNTRLLMCVDAQGNNQSAAYENELRGMVRSCILTECMC